MELWSCLEPRPLVRDNDHAAFEPVSFFFVRERESTEVRICPTSRIITHFEYGSGDISAPIINWERELLSCVSSLPKVCAQPSGQCQYLSPSQPCVRGTAAFLGALRWRHAFARRHLRGFFHPLGLLGRCCPGLAPLSVCPRVSFSSPPGRERERRVEWHWPAQSRSLLIPNGNI